MLDTADKRQLDRIETGIALLLAYEIGRNDGVDWMVATQHERRAFIAAARLLMKVGLVVHADG